MDQLQEAKAGMDKAKLQADTQIEVARINAEAKGFSALKSEIGSIESVMGRFGSSAGLAALGLDFASF